MKHNRALRGSFSQVSDKYDSVRTGYPEELIHDVIALSGIPDNGRILDVGCGPGKATLMFAKKGYHITGLDINKDFIAAARENSPSNADYLVGSFEETEFWNKFNLIISAQAWHWVDPEVSYRKAHSLLTDSGSLALFWKFQNPDKSELVAEVRKLYRKHCPEYPDDFGSTKLVEDQLNSFGLFKPFVKTEYFVEFEYTKEKYLAWVHTLSYVIALEGKKRDAFMDELNALLDKQEDPLKIPYRCVLLLARK